jgi:signal peptidase II
MSPKLRTLLWLVVLIVPLDQLTKYWVSSNIAYGSYVQVIDGFFKITHARNPGAALGIAQGAPIWVFIGLTLLALGMIASFFRKIADNDRLSAVALGLIVSGAIGNLIDRVWHQEVIDFLQFDLQLFIFPDFNVADSAIVIGVGLLLLDVVTQETEQSVSGPPDPTQDAR